MLKNYYTNVLSFTSLLNNFFFLFQEVDVIRSNHYNTTYDSCTQFRLT